MATTLVIDDDLIIDPSMLVEPDESDEDSTEEENKFWFDSENLTIAGESIIDDEEFDENREDIYDPYEEDPSLLDEDDDL